MSEIVIYDDGNMELPVSFDKETFGYHKLI